MNSYSSNLNNLTDLGGRLSDTLDNLKDNDSIKQPMGSGVESEGEPISETSYTDIDSAAQNQPENLDTLEAEDHAANSEDGTISQIDSTDPSSEDVVNYNGANLDEADRSIFPDAPVQPAAAAADAVTIPSFDQTVGDAAKDRKERGKAGKRILIGLAVLLALLGGVYAWGVNHYKDKFLPNTYVSGFNMANLTLDEANEVLSNDTAERKVTIKGKDEQESEVQASQVGLVLEESPEIANTLKEQNPYEWPKYLLADNGTHLTSEHSVDEAALDKTIQSLKIVSGDQVVPTENAKAVFDGNQFVIKDEVYGTQIDQEKLKQAVKDALVSGEGVINLEEAQAYVMPTTTKNSEPLINSVNQLNKAVGTVVTYDFKTAQEVLDKNTFAGWLSTDQSGNVVVDDAQVAAYVQGLADKYDTLGKDITFNTSDSGPIEMTDWYFGWEIDQEAENQELKNIILAGAPVTREPVYSSTGRDRAMGNTITGTYLEISIGEQHMWYYKDGQLITSTPVVTGDTTAGHGTPTGIFELQDKGYDVVLRGEDYASPVTFWMPFDGGVGVHDASWRGAYGGSIFQGNGSHGCVNTPYGAASEIYDNISVGDPVVVYW